MGRTGTTLGRIALTALAALAYVLVPCRARAVVVELPDCDAPRVDPSLLREILELELAHGGSSSDELEVTISDALCDPEVATIMVTIRQRGQGASARDAVLVPADPDAETRARVLAIAIAERARLAIAIAIAERVRLAVATTITQRVRPSEALGTPQRTDVASPSREPEDRVSPIAIGGAVRGLLAPLGRSWALGARVDLLGRFDETWMLRGEVATTWSRGSSIDGEVDAIVLDAGAAFGARLVRDRWIELALALHADVGALVAIGSGPTGRQTAHPWLGVGLELEAAFPIAPGIWIYGATRGSALIFGTRIVQNGPMLEPAVPIELAFFTLALDLGARFAL